MKTELEAILTAIEGTDFCHVNSVELLLDYGFKMNQWIARTGLMMSEAKRDLHNARKDAYWKAFDKLKEQKRPVMPMLLKDYINDTCAEENAIYELAERTNRACTHANSLIITAVSALKEERKAETYSMSVPSNTILATYDQETNATIIKKAS